MSRAMVALLLTVQCCIATADEWGSIRGQIVVDGEIPERQLLIAKDAEIKDKQVCAAEDHYAEDLLIDKESRGLANVFVYLAKKPRSIHPDLIEISEEPVPVEIVGCQFKPRALICRARGQIEIKATDPIVHSHHPYPLKNSTSCSLISAGGGTGFYYPGVAESLPFKVSCDFHPWMIGYWLIVDNPYAALTDKDGKFQIDQLPVGENTFKMWHERPGYLEKTFKITVTAGDAVELPTMKLDPTRLEKPTATK